MKNMFFKKTVALILSTAVVMSIAGCGNSSDADNKEKVTASQTTGGDEKVSFSIAIMNGPKVENSWSEQELEKRFNCDVELIFLPGWDDLNTKVNLLMNDEEQRPDVMWWCGMEKEYKEWVEAGYLLDLVPLLQNIENSNILSYYDDWTMFPTYTNGSIYSIPGDVAEVSCMGTLVREDWLKALNMETPKTMDEYVAYLLACVNNDPDGNGIDDTYGFGGDSGDWKYLAPFMYAYGADFNHFILKDDGTVAHGSTQPQVKDSLALMADLYQKNVFEPSLFSASEGESLFAAGKVGSFYRFLSSLNPSQQYLQNFMENNPTGQYTFIEPIKGPDGFGSDEREIGSTDNDILLSQDISH